MFWHTFAYSRTGDNISFHFTVCHFAISRIFFHQHFFSLPFVIHILPVKDCSSGSWKLVIFSADSTIGMVSGFMPGILVNFQWNSCWSTVQNAGNNSSRIPSWIFWNFSWNSTKIPVEFYWNAGNNTGVFQWIPLGFHLKFQISPSWNSSSIPPEFGSISVSGQLRTYPSPNPTCYN